MIKVNKIIEKTELVDTQIKGITLLTADEVKTYYKKIKVIEETWWLCTEGTLSNTAVVVHSDGYIYYPGCFFDTELGVRPALVIGDSESLKTGDQFILGNYRWTMISDRLALCDDIIGKTCFKSLLTTRDKGYNNYTNSDIKEWLWDWYNKIMEEEII